MAEDLFRREPLVAPDPQQLTKYKRVSTEAPEEGYGEEEAKPTPSPKVRDAPAEIKAKFAFRVFGLVSLQLSLTAMVAYFVSQSELAVTFLRSNTWLIGLALIFVALVVLVFSYKFFRRWSYWQQVSGIVAVTLLMMLALSLLSAKFDTAVFLQAALISSGCLLIYALFFTQSCLGYNRYVLLLITVVILGALAYGLMYIPYQEYWSHPLDQWESRPEDLDRIAVMLFLSGMISVTLIWHLHQRMGDLYPHEYFYGTFQMYIESMTLIGIAFANKVYSDSTAPKSPPH